MIHCYENNIDSLIIHKLVTLDATEDCSLHYHLHYHTQQLAA